MSVGRVMALDVGDRTVGVAVSDPSWTIASGVTTVRRTKLTADLAALAELVEAHEVVRIVVGWPLRMNGKMGAQAFKVQKFSEALLKRIDLPLERWDERLTTKVATAALIEGRVRRARRKQVVDKVAATLILQGWLDAKKASESVRHD